MRYVEGTGVWPYRDYYENVTQVTLVYQTHKTEPSVLFHVEASWFPTSQPKIIIRGSIPHVIGSQLPLYSKPVNLTERTEDALMKEGRRVFQAWLAHLYQEVEGEHDELVRWILLAQHDWEIERKQHSHEPAYSRRHDGETREGYGVEVPGYELIMAATRCGAQETQDRTNICKVTLVFQSSTRPRFFASIACSIPEQGSFLCYQTFLKLGRSAHALIIDSHTVDVEEAGLAEAVSRLLAPRDFDPWLLPAQDRYAFDPVREEKSQLCIWLTARLTESLQNVRKGENTQDAIFVRNFTRNLFLDWEMRDQMEQESEGNLIPIRV